VFREAFYLTVPALFVNQKMQRVRLLTVRLLPGRAWSALLS
jgi:hypothetical protein